MKKSDHVNVNRQQVEQGLPDLLKRLWRYGLVLSGDRHVAEELVQATCLRALEKCAQFQTGTSLSPLDLYHPLVNLEKRIALAKCAHGPGCH